MRHYETLSSAINDLRTRGYIHDFVIRNDGMECVDEHRKLDVEKMDVDEMYRFEGMSNPDDNSVLYAITSKEGYKGVLVDAFGMYSENIAPEMIKLMKMHYESFT
ncbi:phosphoribosylpyrophosphate synthetase [Rapidithrix thailandica]|uniref:Phosphoribosylpyrophosphate synthetase n=1 Tax=Rapidithrix thailandica TaxID=413964 RepID=A0AAW9S2J0_9BACT